MRVNEKSAAKTANRADEQISQEFRREKGQVKAKIGAQQRRDGQLMPRPHVHHPEKRGGNDGGEKSPPVIGRGEESGSDFDGEKDAPYRGGEGASHAHGDGGAHHLGLLGLVLVNAWGVGSGCFWW